MIDDSMMDPAVERKSSTVTISENDSLHLMNLLMQRGYFHDDLVPIQSSTVQFQSIHHNDAEKNTSTNASLYSMDEISLIATTKKSYIMINILRNQFMEEVEKSGRLLILDASEIFGVSTETLNRRVVSWMMDQDISNRYILVTSSNGHVKEIMLQTWFQEQTKVLLTKLHDNPDHGFMVVTDAANDFYKLPIDITLIQLEKCIEKEMKDLPNSQILLMDNGSKAIVTSTYLDFIRQKLTDELSTNCDAPIDIKTLTKSNGWELNWVLRIIKEGLCVPGEFHGETYVPNKYVETKRNLVTSSFMSNGYVTSHMRYTIFGISPSQMKDYAIYGKCEESYVILPNSVIRKDLIIEPLVESAQVAFESMGWLDIQLHIPIELLEYETTDAQTLVDTYLLSTVSGVACVQSDGALFFSQSMIDRFVKTHLGSVIAEYASTKAKEIYKTLNYNVKNSSTHADSSDIGTFQQSGKVKRTSRKATILTSPEDIIDNMAYERGEFPINVIVKSVTEVYPDLLDIDLSPSLLEETCRRAFYTEKFDLMWSTAIHSELQRLVTAKATIKSSDTESRNELLLDGFPSVELAFEDQRCFPMCCYMIQAKAKFLSYIMESTERISDNMKDQLQLDFFTGCCSDFLYRVTQYALFKNNIDNENFSFIDESETPPVFYSPIDVAAASYTQIRLSCTDNKSDALTVLENELPRSIGTGLAQAWDLCKVGNDENVEAFMVHIRENCLTFCGLPFAIYDKKAEKKLISLRRTTLLNRLEQADDLSSALDVVIMLLYQTVKNLVVSGPLLQGPILEMLLTERKVSDSMAKELRSLASIADRNIELDSTITDRLQRLVQKRS